MPDDDGEFEEPNIRQALCVVVFLMLTANIVACVYFSLSRVSGEHMWSFIAAVFCGMLFLLYGQSRYGGRARR